MKYIYLIFNVECKITIRRVCILHNNLGKQLREQHWNILQVQRKLGLVLLMNMTMVIRQQIVQLVIILLIRQLVIRQLIVLQVVEQRLVEPIIYY